MRKVTRQVEWVRGRSFVVSAYLADAEGRLRADVPDRCPLAISEGPKQRCSVRIDHLRKRIDGPGFPIAVCRCRPHGIAFTIYPPGFGPYLRRPVILARPDGGPVGQVHNTYTPAPSAVAVADHDLRVDFRGTLFEAAIHAAERKAWPRHSDSVVQKPAWSTQKRHLALGIRMLGLEPGTGADQLVQIGTTLDVSATELLGFGKHVTGYQTAGRAILEVLNRLHRIPRRAMDLLACAHLAGTAGRPWRWGWNHGYQETCHAFPGLATTGGP